MRAVQPGEQVTISYTDLLQTLDERQQSLIQRYAFNCCCKRCLDDSPTPGDWFLDAVAADGKSLLVDEWSYLAVGVLIVTDPWGGRDCRGGERGRVEQAGGDGVGV